MRMYDATILDKITARCRAQGTLVIFDEVMTGFGRTGPLFASHSVQNKPDLICLSKGITGGMLPLGATTMTAAIREACRDERSDRTFFHGHSFTGNALSCACAIASLELVTAPSCVAARQRISDRHADFHNSLQRRYPGISSRHHGTILAVDFPHATPTGYVHPLRRRLLQEFLTDNVLLRPLGNTVYIIPPYCISEEQLQTVYNSIGRVLEMIRAEGRSPL